MKHGSPAEQAGLQTGDVILSFNEVPIQTDEEVKERIENLSIGDKFRLKVWRKGQKMNVTLKVGDSILKMFLLLGKTSWKEWECICVN